MKNLERCTKKIIAQNNVLSRINRTSEEQGCQECNGYDNKCPKYTIPNDDCFGL